jgi:hypothetical protein
MNTHVRPPSVERSTRNPSSLRELSVHRTTMAVLPYGIASVPDGGLGGAVATVALAMFEASERPPSLLARTT